MYASLPWIGIVLFAATLRPIIVKRTRVTVLNMIAVTFLMIAFILWPDENGMALDRVLHVAGLGQLVSRVFITLAATLHPVAVAMSIGLWDRTRKLMLIPVAVFGAIYVAFWFLVHGEHGYNLEALFYYGYHGRPDTALWLSLSRGITILFYSSFGVYVYAVVAARARDQWRWTAIATGAVFVGCVALGIVAIVEALADRAGVTSPVLLSLFSIMLVGCGGLIMVVYILYTNVRPLWQLIQEARALPRMRDELRHLRDDVRDFNVRLSDVIVLLRSYADPDIVRDVKDACQRYGLTEDECRIAEEAARWITFNPENIHRLRRYDDQALETRAVAARGAQEFAILAERGLYFYGDVYIVAALAMGAEQFGVTLHREPQDWHRRTAAIIADVLAVYHQSEETLASFRKEVAERETAKRDLLDALVLARQSQV